MRTGQPTFAGIYHFSLWKARSCKHDWLFICFLSRSARQLFSSQERAAEGRQVGKFRARTSHRATPAALRGAWCMGFHLKLSCRVQFGGARDLMKRRSGSLFGANIERVPPAWARLKFYLMIHIFIIMGFGLQGAHVLNCHLSRVCWSHFIIKLWNF